jgi:hypothetical protein
VIVCGLSFKCTLCIYIMLFVQYPLTEQNEEISFLDIMTVLKVSILVS